MTAKSNTHGPAENQMSTGFTLDGFPSIGRVGELRAGQREPTTCPRSSPSPTRAACRRSGRTTGAAGSCPRSSRARRSTPTSRSRNLAPPGERERRSRRRHARLPEAAQRRAPEAAPRRHANSRPASPATSWPRGCSCGAPRSPTCRRRPQRVHDEYGADDANKLKAGFARNCLLARRLLERGVRFVQLFNGAYAMGEGVGNWDGHKTLKTQYDIHAPDPRPAVPRRCSRT